MKFILGKKLKMSRIFDKEGNALAVTWVEAGPCFVTQVKTKEKDGYEAIQIGFERKKKNIKKTEKGKEFKYLREFRVNDKKLKVGDKIDVSIFKEGDLIEVSGTSKSKGFQGVVKRWGFHGAPKTHGTKHMHRKPGSIGASSIRRVWKGKKMAGRMGGERINIKNLKVIKIQPEENLMAIKGALPGRKGTILEIRGK